MIFQSIVQYAAVLTSTRNINMHKINDTRKIKMKIDSGLSVEM